MKETITISAVIRLLISGVLTVAAVLTLASCTPATGPETSGLPAGKGMVNIRLGVDEPAAPVSSVIRTLLPGSVAAGAFSSYTLVFTPSGGGVSITFTDHATLSGITLNVGTYDLSLTAYTVSGENKTEAAAGSAGGITVTNGGTENVTVPLLFKPGAGDGTLGFTVVRPSTFDLNGAQFSLAPLSSGGTTYGSDWLKIMYTGEKKTSHSSDESIASGYYLAAVTLFAAGRKAVRSDIVHIGAGQTTTLNWTFAETDFSMPITSLPAPGKPGLTAGAVTWPPVNEASSYTVKLYKQGTNEAVGTYPNQNSGATVLNHMRNHGAGSYTVTVSAIGDGINWLDSAESAASDPETVSVLATPSALAWNGTMAEWTGDVNAGTYTVKLYRGESLVETVSTAASPLDLSSSLGSAGAYTFTVQAVGLSSSLYLDSAVSTASGVKQTGGAASIVLTVSENWTGTLEAAGGGSTSIVKGTGSLTINVTGNGFTSFVWIVDGTTLPDTTASIILSGANYSLGGHSVTVYARDSTGVFWSPPAPISFTVTAN